MQDEVMGRFILAKFDELTALVAGLDDAAVNRTPTADAAASNSPVQLLAHVRGMMRRWSSTVNLGVEVPRDRAAEFTARMPVAEALEAAAQTRALFVEDLARTVDDAPPAAVPVGREDFWTQTCHGVLLHVFEEVCQHLGHAEIARDVAQEQSPRPT